MKRIFAMILALAICLSFAACGNNGTSNGGGNNAGQNSNAASKQTDYPKMDEIEYYFVNGVSYGEPAALMGFTNNSKFTITSMLIYFTVKADATQEELAAFDNFVSEGDLEAEKIPSLSPYIYNHMVCDPGEKVEGATCTLFGNQEATDAKQCELLVVKSAEISFQGNDGQIYTVEYAAENNGYSLQSGAKAAKSWTEKDFAKAIPTPDTRFITVDYDNDDYYQFTAYDITFEQYQAYCNECQTAGFTNDIEDNKGSFWCTNDSGLTLNIKYFAYMNALIVYAE